MLLDTNILIAHLNGEPGVASLFVRAVDTGHPFYISAISITELFAYEKLTLFDIGVIKRFTASLSVLSIDELIAERASFFMLRRRLTLADALIAATASVRKLSLITRDKELLRLQEISVRKI